MTADERGSSALPVVRPQVLRGLEFNPDGPRRRPARVCGPSRCTARELRINATSYSRYRDSPARHPRVDKQHADAVGLGNHFVGLLCASDALVRDRASELPRRKYDVQTGVTAGVVLEVLVGVTPGAVFYVLGTARHLQSS